jgi:ABC-type sulfate transport system substrate-binding protein
MGNFLRTRRVQSLGAAIAVFLAGLAAGGCGGSSGPDENEIFLVGYSTPGPVWEKVIEPAFQKTPEGRGVTFVNSFGPSVDQSRAVAAGQPASVVNFSNIGDVERLVEEGEIVPRYWANNDAQKSAVAMIVRKGNPKGLKTFHDLLAKDVKIIIPSSSSSGIGRWDFMAIYMSELHEGASHQEALNAIKAILKKTVAQPRSAEDGMAAFLEGKGDVLLSYESEGVDAKREGKGDYVVPVASILIDAPLVATKGAGPAAEAFVEFDRSKAAQELWAAHGYRPIYTNLSGPTPIVPSVLFRIDHPGEWKKINREFFDEGTGSIAKMEKELSIPAGG